MAKWTAALDRPLVVEPPNLVAYITYSSDDGRVVPAERTPGDSAEGIKTYSMRRRLGLEALDARNAAMQAALNAAPGVLDVGPIGDVDLSRHEAVATTFNALSVKIAAVEESKRIEAATAVDPTIDAAAAAWRAAKATLGG